MYTVVERDVVLNLSKEKKNKSNVTILSCHISNYVLCVSHTIHGRYHIFRRGNILTHSLM